MLEMTKRHCAEYQRRLKDEGIDLALIADEDSIAYLAGFWGYLGVEFGRPTVLLLPAEGSPTVITPLMESEMAAAMTWVEDVRPWEDAGERRWENVLRDAIPDSSGLVLGIEAGKLPPLLASYLDSEFPTVKRADASAPLGAMRMIKDPEEIEIMRQGGQVAIAMVEAGKAALGEGVPEYEVALAIIAGGTRKAAEFLTDKGWEAFVSPTIHNLQVLQSGHDTAMVHRRSNVRRLERGDPIYMCFCGMITFKQYKMGFDREYFIGAVNDEQARVYETTIAAQLAALEAVRPGATAEEVHRAANKVYASHGFAPGYRTGRSVGMSNLEAPEIKDGDQTVLQAGMTFAIDGGITLPGKFGGRVGDTIVVTDSGFEYLTPFPKDLCVI